jgi:hypothetical protein
LYCANRPIETDRQVTRIEAMLRRISALLRFSPRRFFWMRRSGLRSFSQVMPKPRMK